MSTILPEWRCTRPDRYPLTVDIASREGYYIRASTAQGAGEAMLDRFPADSMIAVQPWKDGEGYPVDDATSRRDLSLVRRSGVRKGSTFSATMRTFRVTGSGDFPYDMLRYDRCWPAGEHESAKLYGDAHETRTVELFGVDDPTVKRWNSFGWRVE